MCDKHLEFCLFKSQIFLKMIYRSVCVFGWVGGGGGGGGGGKATSFLTPKHTPVVFICCLDEQRIHSQGTSNNYWDVAT